MFKHLKQFAGRWMVVALILVLAAFVLYNHLSRSLGFDAEYNARFAPAQVSAAIRNDIDVLLDRCGRPDRITKIGGFEPGPLVPQRIMTYKRAHLRLAYVDADPVGHAPPFDWMLSTAFDTRTNRPLDLNTVQERLPCLAEKPR